MITIDGKQYFTVKEAAQKLSLHRVTVGKYIRAGKIEAFKLAERYLIQDKNIRKFLEECEKNNK